MLQASIKMRTYSLSRCLVLRPAASQDTGPKTFIHLASASIVFRKIRRFGSAGSKQSQGLTGSPLSIPGSAASTLMLQTTKRSTMTATNTEKRIQSSRSSASKLMQYLGTFPDVHRTCQASVHLIVHKLQQVQPDGPERSEHQRTEVKNSLILIKSQILTA